MKNRKAIFMNSTLDADTRTRDLLSRMTLEEKVCQMSMSWIGKFLHRGRFSAKAFEVDFRGHSIGCLQEERITTQASALMVNAVQRYMVEKTRLGIPVMIVGEALHGHYASDSTVFPQSIGLGCTWNPSLVEQLAAVAGREARAHGVAQVLAPDLDLGRDARWGRQEETYSEDPHLVSRMGVAYIRGMQGTGPGVDRNHCVCTIKHFAAHGSPEAGLNLGPVAGGLRDLYSLYLPPFRAAIREANPLSAMPCYSEYDGLPAHASGHLLTRILREELGFAGYTFADYDGVRMLHTFHKVAVSAADAGRQALTAGLDLEAASPYGYGDEFLNLVRQGGVDEALVNRAVHRILRVKFLAGLFENPYIEIKKVAAVTNSAAHRRLAREAARESIVLLKNEAHLLPLIAKDMRSLAVIGPNADVAQIGDYAKPRADMVTPLQGIRAAAGRGVRIRHEPGCGLYEQDRSGFEAAVTAARESDVALVIIGESSLHFGGVGWGEQNRPALCGEGSDSHSVSLPGVQEELVRAIHATGTPTVVVLIHGRALALPWLAENIPAMVTAWYPGEQGGHALADILFGKDNPSGRLSVTFPRSAGHIPCCYNHKPSAGGFYHRPGNPGKPGMDYVFSTPEPVWTFGHGLSYTTFRYSRLKVSPRASRGGGCVSVSVDVRNTGRRAGKETVQLYLRDLVSSVTTPVKALKRFQKILLKPGETRTVKFELEPEDLQVLDANMNWVVEPGDFEVNVAGLSKIFSIIP
jgi:beta-glucosidase